MIEGKLQFLQGYEKIIAEKAKAEYFCYKYNDDVKRRNRE